ncbi:hypothetical protein MHAE_16596 [Mycobacterium haemophilum DSM 44634]
MRRRTADEDQYRFFARPARLHENAPATLVQFGRVGSRRRPGVAPPCAGTDGRADENRADTGQPQRLTRRKHLPWQRRHPSIG